MDTSGYRRLRKPAPGSQADSSIELGSSMDKYVTRTARLDSLVPYGDGNDNNNAGMDSLALSHSVLSNSLDVIVQQRIREFESRISDSVMQVVDSRIRLLEGSVDSANAAVAQDVRNHAVEINAMKSIQSELVRNLTQLRQSVTDSLSQSQDRAMESVANVQLQSLSEANDMKTALSSLRNELHFVKSKISALTTRTEAMDVLVASHGSNIDFVQQKIGQLGHQLETSQVSSVSLPLSDDQSNPHSHSQPTSPLLSSQTSVGTLSPIRGGWKGRQLASLGASPSPTAGMPSPVPLLLDGTANTSMDGRSSDASTVLEIESKLSNLQERVNVDIRSRLTQFESSIISNLDAALMQMDELRSGLQRDQQTLMNQLMQSVRGTMQMISSRTSELSLTLSELQQTIPLLAQCLEEEVKTRTRTVGILNDKVDAAIQSWRSMSSSLTSSVMQHMNNILSSALLPIEQQMRSMDEHQGEKNKALGEAVYVGLEKEASLRRALEKRMYDAELAVHSLKANAPSLSNTLVEPGKSANDGIGPNSTRASKLTTNNAVSLASPATMASITSLGQRMSKQYRDVRRLLDTWSSEGILERMQEMENSRREDMTIIRSLRRQIKQLEVEVRVSETHRESEETMRLEKQETGKQRLRVLESKVTEAMRGLQTLQSQLGIYDVSDTVENPSGTILGEMRKEIQGVVSGMQGMQQFLMSKMQDIESTGKENETQLQALSLSLTPSPAPPLFISPGIGSNFVTSTTPGMAPSQSESTTPSGIGNMARSPGMAPDSVLPSVSKYSVASPDAKVVSNSEQSRLSKLEEQHAELLEKVAMLQSSIATTGPPGGSVGSAEDAQVASPADKVEFITRDEFIALQSKVEGLRHELHDQRVYLEQLVSESKFSALEHTDHTALDLETNLGREVDELWEALRSIQSHQMHGVDADMANSSLPPGNESQRSTVASARSRSTSGEDGMPQLPPLAPLSASSSGNVPNPVSLSMDLSPAPPLTSLAISPPDTPTDLFTVSVDPVSSTSEMALPQPEVPTDTSGIVSPKAPIPTPPPPPALVNSTEAVDSKVVSPAVVDTVNAVVNETTKEDIGEAVGVDVHLSDHVDVSATPAISEGDAISTVSDLTSSEAASQTGALDANISESANDHGDTPKGVDLIQSMQSDDSAMESLVPKDTTDIVEPDPGISQEVQPVDESPIAGGTTPPVSLGSDQSNAGNVSEDGTSEHAEEGKQGLDVDIPNSDALKDEEETTVPPATEDVKKDDKEDRREHVEEEPVQSMTQDATQDATQDTSRHATGETIQDAIQGGTTQDGATQDDTSNQTEVTKGVEDGQSVPSIDAGDVPNVSQSDGPITTVLDSPGTDSAPQGVAEKEASKEEAHPIVADSIDSDSSIGLKYSDK